MSEIAGAGWPEGYDKRILEEVSSTMDAAAAVATELTRPTWIFARQQTGARGRRGRAWAMPEGNFAATLLLKPEGAVGQVALRSFAAALALDAALQAVGVPEGDLALKWPNDVLYRGGKLAGILLESEAMPQPTPAKAATGVAWLSIGFGVNLAAAPEPLPPGTLSESPSCDNRHPRAPRSGVSSSLEIVAFHTRPGPYHPRTPRVRAVKGWLRGQ